MENSKKTTAIQAAVIGAKLLLICAIVAGVVSFVFALTLDQYNANLEGTKKEAIGALFSSETIDASTITYSVLEENTEKGAVAYSVKSGDTPIGYCVEITSAGFGGDLGLMVAYETDLTLKGVHVISNSETPGVGSKAVDPNGSYLPQYKGLDGTKESLALGTDLDAVSGATISSRAILDGVNAANRFLASTMDGGND